LQSSPGRRRSLPLAGALLAAALLLGGPAHAQPGAASPSLDRLLKIPDATDYSTDVKGGASRAEWRQRFGDARSAVASAERALAASQAKLADSAGEKSEWQFSPPGVPAQEATQDSSSNYQLREQVRRQRGELDRSRARLRELDVQANLAGVPEEWRGSSTDAGSGDAAKNGSGTGAAAPR
jgi:hypothetical protein